MVKNRVKQKEEQTSSIYFFIIGIFCLIIGISYLISILSDFSISKIEEVWSNSINMEPTFIFVFGMIILGIVSIIYGINKYKNKK